MGTGDGSGPTRTKVERLLEEYDLGEDYGDALERAWTGEDGERTSLRDLATEFNRELVARAIDDAGMSTVDGEVDNLHRVLTTDEVTSGARTSVRSRLTRNGVDVDELERDFVTYQAIRSYLRDVREAELDAGEDRDRVARTADSIGRLRSRLAAVSENNLDRLRESDRLTLGEFRLFTSVDVLCEDCESQYSAAELLERGGCDCEPAAGDD